MGFVSKYACWFLCPLLLCIKGQCQSFGIENNQVLFTTDSVASSGDFQKLTLDSNHLFIISDINITGNKRTKANTILREVSFNVDDHFPLNVIVDKFYETKKQLMNTGLFRNVVVSLKSLQGYNVYVNIDVEEKWYIYPIPFLRPVDKSFHDWWTKDRSIDRVNYGIRLEHHNFTGRNDKFNLRYMNGFTKELSIQYYGLYLDKDLKWSASGGFGFGQVKELNYITLDNKLVALRYDNKFLNSYFHAFGELTYRPAIKTRHTFNIEYNYNDIADTIFKLNPHFSSNKNILRFLGFTYRMTYFDVDFIPYPTKGFAGEVSLKRQGFNDPINLWQLTAKGSNSWPIGDRYFFNLGAVGMIKLPFNQPYISAGFLGYDDQYLQGYEYYVVDGVAGGYSKATLTRQVINTHINIPSKRFKQLNYIPFKLYVKTFVNAGYVYNPQAGPNSLDNTFLYSGGIGFDIVAFTDFVIKIEWSFNHLAENGVYLHRSTYF
jgi:outer membrane protein assembly factor BamA